MTALGTNGSGMIRREKTMAFLVVGRASCQPVATAKALCRITASTVARSTTAGTIARSQEQKPAWAADHQQGGAAAVANVLCAGRSVTLRETALTETLGSAEAPHQRRWDEEGCVEAREVAQGGGRLDALDGVVATERGRSVACMRLAGRTMMSGA